MKTANALNFLLAIALVCVCATMWLRTKPAAAPSAAAPAEAAAATEAAPAAPAGGFHGHNSGASEAAFAAIRAVSGGASAPAPAVAPSAPAVAPAFREFDVHAEFGENPFTWFTGKGLLLCAGDREASNAMTIGWGGLGTLWGRNDAVTVYVAQARHTREFMDRAGRFTVMAFDKERQAGILEYMGTHSGRDGDKAAALGLHTVFTEDGTPYYEEAETVLECETMYAAPFDPAGFREVPAGFYANFPAGVHSVYIGRIVRALKK